MTTITLNYKNRVKETTTSVGSGNLTLDGASTGFRPFSVAGNGVKVPYTIEDASKNCEYGYGTITDGVLTREVIWGTHSGSGTTPIDFGAGTKDVWLDFHAESLVSPYKPNLMYNSIKMNSNRLTLDGDHDTYIESTSDDEFNVFLGGVIAGTWTNVGLYIKRDITGTAVGPELVLVRRNSNPEEDALLGAIRFDGENSNDESLTYARITTRADVVTDGSEDSTLLFYGLSSGTLTSYMRLNKQALGLLNDVALLVGKTTVDGGATDGVEITKLGRIYARASGQAPLVVDRSTNDGQLVDFRRALSGTVGEIRVTAGTVAYNTFTGGHWSLWASGHEQDSKNPPKFGTLVERVSERAYPLKRRLDVDTEWCENMQLPACRVSSGEYASRTVYGSFVGYADGDLQIWSIGTGVVRVVGPVTDTDILVASTTPGCACAWEGENPPWPNAIVGYSTVNDPRTHDRCVPIIHTAG